MMHPISPASLFASIVRHRSLIVAMIKRDVYSRYRGSIIGMLWSFLNPLLMLAVYTFVFSVVFNARWGGGLGSKTEFALVLFSGLMAFNIFSESANRAPTLITGNVNYVKKVIFPLEILPVVALGSAMFHFCISLLVWLIFFAVIVGVPYMTILWLPMALLPLTFLSLGSGWLLASLGVYLRDVGQVIGVMTTVLMFLSPIFYPLEALPEEYRSLLVFNPLASQIEQLRNIMIFGRGPDFFAWAWQVAVSVLVAYGGFVWFQRTRGGFADVI